MEAGLFLLARDRDLEPSVNPFTKRRGDGKLLPGPPVQLLLAIGRDAPLPMRSGGVQACHGAKETLELEKCS
ncbi:Hypothetical protein BN69_3414 [Methylocystis sp. SC2]|nr:Hypothetical protein BN69_3414 [Methylocystis sp. SC2]